MKAYSREEWGISRTEYNRLMEAVEQGVIPDFTVEGSRYELQQGYITADEVIRSFDSGRRFHSEFAQSKDCIDEYEFEKIVSDVLGGNSDVASYEFFGTAVQITLYSRSGKSKWNTFLDFNDGGRITGIYTYTQGYEGATQPWSIGNKISRKIKSTLYD